MGCPIILKLKQPKNHNQYIYNFRVIYLVFLFYLIIEIKITFMFLYIKVPHPIGYIKVQIIIDHFQLGQLYTIV